jgi:hypothetical protein
MLDELLPLAQHLPRRVASGYNHMYLRVAQKGQGTISVCLRRRCEHFVGDNRSAWVIQTPLDQPFPCALGIALRATEPVVTARVERCQKVPGTGSRWVEQTD